MAIDMSEATVETNRKGKKYQVLEVMTVDVPEDFKGKFLMLDSNTGKVMYKKAIALSDKEKAARAQARQEAKKAKYAEQVKTNAAASDKIGKLRAEISELNKDVLAKARERKDVSALYEKIDAKEARIKELQATKKFVPKKFR